MRSALESSSSSSRLRSAAAIVFLGLLAGGCQSLPERSAADELRETIMKSVRESVAEAGPGGPPPVAPDPEEALGLSKERVEALREMGGPSSYRGEAPEFGPGLRGVAATVAPLTLDEATALAIRGDTGVRAVRLEPPIAQAELIAAEAAFDWTLFASAERSFTDQEQPVPVVGMTPVGTGLSRSDAFSASAGFRKLLTTNGTLELSTSLDIFNNATPGFTRIPDPARTASFDLLYNQPLLRNFGPAVALADVRLAENATAQALERARDGYFTTITNVQASYWNLHQARQRLLIVERLLARGIETRDALRGRYGFDVTDAELADASARVESRRADLIRAQQAVRDASDELKRLINDPSRGLLDERVIEPTDEPLTVAIRYDLVEAVAGAIARRPDTRRALLRIKDQLVLEGVARNATLPRLDAFLRVGLVGLEGETDEAYEEALESDFVNSAFGLEFEYPIGNREAEARRRAARLRTLQSAIDYRDAVRRAITDVKVSLRTLETSYRLIQQTRVARIAATENLRALQVEEETIRGLTPDFLNLKLNRQEALAQAEIAEAQARADYARAAAEAARALGLTLEQSGFTVDPALLDADAMRLLERDPDRPLLDDRAGGSGER